MTTSPAALSNGHDRRHARASAADEFRDDLLPLWEVDQSGWFVYDHVGRLAYVNPAMVTIIGRRPPLGSTEFILTMSGRMGSAVQRLFRNLRSGSGSACSMVVTAVVDAEMVPLRLSMSPSRQARIGRSVLGNVSRVFSTGQTDTEDEHHAAEHTLERILAEVNAVLMDPSGVTAAPQFDELTTRQNEIVSLILAGYDTAGIARRLHLSHHTVRNHTQAILRRLNVHSQAELIAWCRARQIHPSAGGQSNQRPSPTVNRSTVRQP